MAMERSFSGIESACDKCDELYREYLWIEDELARATEVLRIGVKAGDDHAIPEALAGVNVAQLLRIEWRARIREHESDDHPGFWRVAAAR